jgi:hypothetical protein
MVPFATLALTVFGGAVLLAACSPRAPIEAPALSSAAPSATVIAATPTVVPTAAPAPPPTGPGTIACGATRCRAGAEICCLGEPARCVPAPAVPPDSNTYQEASVRQKACGTNYILACDDAGDCGAGQTCCEETYESETSSIYQGVCRPLRAGRVTCARAELCSADDGRCARKDNACADVNGTLRCQLPISRRAHPRCGKKPCPDDMTCVLQDGEPTCVKGAFRNELPFRAGVIECDRGRDCGEDESCYQNPQLPGRRCDFAIAGVDGLSERAYCTSAEDCAGYCRLAEGAVPNCHVDPKARSGRCECLDRCAKDADCEGCGRLGVLREDLDPNAAAFCDRKKGACECRARKR